jgi:uncharacterized protein
MADFDADDVAQWLRTHTDFFESNPELLTSLRVPHPEGEHLISIVERQLIAFREKNAQLEKRINEFIGYGQHNDLLADRIHRMSLALLRSVDLETTLDVVRESLRSDFKIPHVAVKQWHAAAHDDVSADMRSYVDGLDRAYVGPLAAYESAAWFNSVPDALQSFAYVPLGDGESFGVLCLASEDAARFTPDMAVDVLERVGNLVSAAIARFTDDAERKIDEIG